MSTQQQQQLQMLRDYCHALESQNKTRNQQRMILQEQIKRLTKSDKTQVSIQCQQCKKYKTEILRLENTIQRLQKQTSNLQNANNLLSLSISKGEIQRIQKQERVIEVRREIISGNGYARVQGSNVTLGTGSTVGKITYQELENKNKDNEKKIAQLNTKHIQLTTKYSQLTTTYNQLNTTYNKLNTQYNQLSSKHINLAVQHQSLKALRNSQTPSLSPSPPSPSPVIKILQSQVSALKTQKNTLSLNISTLEQELHRVKRELNTKEQQIYTMKKNIDGESKGLREAIVSKDKEILVLRDRLKGVGDAQFQIRNLRKELRNREEEVQCIRGDFQVLKLENEKIYRLQAELRSTKYQLTQKDTQLQKLHKKQQQPNPQLVTLQSQLSTLQKSHNQTLQSLQSLQSQNTRIPSLLQQISKYQLQIQYFKSHLMDNNNQNQNNLKKEADKFRKQVEELKGELADKEEYIRKVEDQLGLMGRKDQQKDREVRELDKIVNTYMQKITQLQIQLNRIQKNTMQQQQTQHIQVHQTCPQLNTTFNPTPQLQLLTQQNLALNTKIQSHQHRIHVLQQTNRSLRSQLQSSIEGRNRQRQASRLYIQQSSSSSSSFQPTPSLHENIENNEQFLKTVRMLKKQVDQLRNVNARIRVEKEELGDRLGKAEMQLEGFVGIGRSIDVGRSRMEMGMGEGRGEGRGEDNDKGKGDSRLMGMGMVGRDAGMSNRDTAIGGIGGMGGRDTAMKDIGMDTGMSKTSRNGQLGIIATNKILSNMPMVQSSKMYSTQTNRMSMTSGSSKLYIESSSKSQSQLSKHIYTVLDDKERDPLHLTQHLSSTSPDAFPSSFKSQTNQASTSSRIAFGGGGKIVEVSNISGNSSSGYVGDGKGKKRENVGDLQKKIQMLKQENKGLRKHLYDGSS